MAVDAGLKTMQFMGECFITEKFPVFSRPGQKLFVVVVLVFVEVFGVGERAGGGGGGGGCQ